MDGDHHPQPQPPRVELDVCDMQSYEDINEASDIMPVGLDELQMSFASQPDSTLSPPARIAARFYRSPPLGRRKSSAASSRRNSLSSTHSMQSNSSYRQACRSNHVAQYLRRASIIESRKARLAAREAHADQVRLRAALARTAPRSSNSEERALAAKQARDERLAQIAATCSEEVKRAKRIAEETRERRAAEEERYRLEIEEKLADAERRRNEYKRNNSRRPRTASTPPAGESKKPSIKFGSSLDKVSAAQYIQRTWRAWRRRRMFDEYLQLGLTIDKIHNTTFEAIRQLLCDEHVLAVTRTLLGILRVGIDEAAGADGYLTTRSFLTAYLLLGHPTHVMNQCGDQEQDLIQKAKDLIINVEAALDKYSRFNNSSLPSTQLESLQMAHDSYATAFAAWKTKDKTILVELLVQDFVNLDAIWQTVKDDTVGRVAEDYQTAIRENQVQLLARLRNLAGPERANQLIRKAIRDSRRRNQVGKQISVGDIRPRLTSTNKSVTNLDLSQGSDAVIEETHLTPSAPQSDAFQTKSIAHLFSIMPSNRVVTHELVINKDFRLDTTPQSNARNEIHRKICDAMLEAFKSGDGDRWTVAIADNVRAKLLHLLMTSNGEGSMYNLINEALDPDLIQRQCAQGIFSYQNFFNFMANILPKLCAPFRDEQVKALADDLQRFGSMEEMIEKLFRLFDMTDVMALDFSNFLLSQVAPRLIKVAPGYEQRMFAKDLAEGKHSLQNAQRWWNDASVNVLTEADRLDPTYKPTIQKIYYRGLVDLAIATAPLRDSEMPETLELDKARIISMRKASLNIAIVGSILLSAKNLLKRDVRIQWKNEANRMLDALEKTNYSDDSLSGRLLSIAESAQPFPPSTKLQIASTITRLLLQASSGRLVDPVARVLFNRLRQHVFTCISANSSNERAQVISTASEKLSAAGLPEFSSTVAAIVETLSKIGEVDRRSHGIWYEQIAAANEQHDVEEGEIVLEKSEKAEQAEQAEQAAYP